MFISVVKEGVVSSQDQVEFIKKRYEAMKVRPSGS